MYHQFNIQQCMLSPHCIYVLYLSEKNSSLCFLQDKLIGFYDIDLNLYNPVVTIYTPV